MNKDMVGEFEPAQVLAWSESEVNESDDSAAPTIGLWKPAGTTAALGLAQKPEVELNLDAMRQDRIGLVRRQSGGGAVLLYNGVLCWEAWVGVKTLQSAVGGDGIRQSYAYLAEPVIAALKSHGIDAFSAGICDLSARCGDGEIRKLAGTAQLRRKKAVLVHGALLVGADVAVMGKYLLFPSSQPDYRKDRDHRSFCISIAEMIGISAGTAQAEDLPDQIGTAIAEEAGRMGWKTIAPPQHLSGEAQQLLRQKYGNPAWNWKKERASS
ncbi:MAG: lipoate--protein ligase family protein [Planctomycetes bacterium]|nr:lipoate--protein ligase family protein [Planctomycetota bacterium]